VEGTDQKSTRIESPRFTRHCDLWILSQARISASPLLVRH
jgi:hypothetical protein